MNTSRTRSCAFGFCLVLAGCGGGHQAAGGDENTIACIGVQDGETLCTEHVGLKSDDMRLAAGVNCRASGGHTAARCPTSKLVGFCEVKNDARHAGTYSQATRTAVYAGGRRDPESEKLSCSKTAQGTWVPAE